jgi:hypothetical protein
VSWQATWSLPLRASNQGLLVRARTQPQPSCIAGSDLAGRLRPAYLLSTF